MPRNFSRDIGGLDFGHIASMRPRQMPRNFGSFRAHYGALFQLQ